MGIIKKTEHLKHRVLAKHGKMLASFNFDPTVQIILLEAKLDAGVRISLFFRSKHENPFHLDGIKR